VEIADDDEGVVEAGDAALLEIVARGVLAEIAERQRGVLAAIAAFGHPRRALRDPREHHLRRQSINQGRLGSLRSRRHRSPRRCVVGTAPRCRAPIESSRGESTVTMRAMPDDSARISPTAHYTAAVWRRAGLSPPALATPLGRALHLALRGANLGYELGGDRPSLDMMLLARHCVLDFLLERAISKHKVSQVIEIAAGLSARGWRFTHRYPSIRYVEGDLPEMAAIKRRRLDEAGERATNHEIVELDALAGDGPRSLPAIASQELALDQGTAIITEGLLGYFDRATVEAMWRRFATVLARFPEGLYLSDLNIAGDVAGMRSAHLFRRLLSLFARGEVHLHYQEDREVAAALRAAGFEHIAVKTPGEFPAVDFPGRNRRHVVRLIEAAVG
jgi:O-methyltransferase involved in polyketide biosynthesis